MDRQEQIRGHGVGDVDAPDQTGPRSALGHEQPGPGKALGLQLLFDPMSKAQIENELGDVAGAHRALGFGGMSDIENDPEFRRVACHRPCRGRTRRTRAQRGYAALGLGGMPGRGGGSLRRGGVAGRSDLLWFVG